jgi:hypothetical protein
MAVVEQTRRPDPTETHAATVAIDAAPAGGAVLHVRLWARGGTSELALAAGNNIDPAVCLATDLLAASGGSLVEAGGPFLVARFPSLQAGVLAARRLQWAAQGFSEAQNRRETCAAIVVQNTEDFFGGSSDGSFSTVLEGAAPGQILLTEDAGRGLDEMAGFSLGSQSDAGFRELFWRSEDQHSTRSTDERVIAWFIEQKGPDAYSEAYSAGPAVATSIGAGEAGDMSGAGQGHSEGAWWRLSVADIQGRGPLLWIVGGAVVVVLVLAAVFVFHPFGGKKAPIASTQAPAGQESTAAGTPAAQTPVAEVPQPEPVQPARPEPSPKPAAPKTPTPKQTRRQEQAAAASTPKQEAPKPAAAPSPKAGGKCDLDPGQYGGQIEQAEANLARGRYRDAARQFGSVLACEPGNGRARGGLDRVHQAEQAEGAASQ